MSSRSSPLLSLRTLLARGALALVLVLAQQHATLHWLSHAIDTMAQKAAQKPAPSTSSDACDECAGLDSLHAFAAPAPFVPLLLQASHAHAATATLVSARCGLQLAFRSRAPPRWS
jgi:hypothetical protein